MVLRHALLPSWLLGDTTGSLPPCLWSIWSFDLRMKLAIIAVCRTWNQIGVELLYNAVTIRRISQVPAFMCALESREGLGTLVRSLDINCAVPPRFSASFETSATKIFQLCPRLSHFGFSPAEDPTHRLGPYKSRGLFPAPTNSITSLRFNDQVLYDSTILPMLVHCCRSLQMLVLTVGRSIQGTDDPRLVFENLEDLDLDLASDSKTSATSDWVMPRLRRVWLRSSPSSGATLLKACGRTLFFLSLRCFYSHNGDAIQNLLDCCPSLKHLAIAPAPRTSMQPLKHATVNWVDLFYSLGDGGKTSFDVLKEGFPALRTLRIFDTSVSLLQNIPDTISPAEIEGYFASIPGPDEDGLWITTVLSRTNSGDDEDEDGDDSYIPEGGDTSLTYGSDTDDAGSDSNASSGLTEYDEEEPVFDFFDPSPMDG
jgi:hypothetical protein